MSGREAGQGTPAGPGRPVLREAVLVEGRYDAHAVRAAVEATVLETGGFGVFRDAELRVLLRRLARERGLIILTDSDGAGFVIRNHLKGVLPGENVKHAYIPSVAGRERRKRVPGREGLLGVEGMAPDVIRDALFRAGATVEADEKTFRQNLTKADFYAWGLSGLPDAAARRERVLRALGFPLRMSANALLAALSSLYDRDGAEAAVKTALL